MPDFETMPIGTREAIVDSTRLLREHLQRERTRDPQVEETVRRLEKILEERRA